MFYCTHLPNQMFKFFCVTMVIAGRIDHAHHSNNAYKALTETLMLSEAVKVADDLTEQEDTLIIVTADHEHPFTFHTSTYLEGDFLGKCHFTLLKCIYILESLDPLIRRFHA